MAVTELALRAMACGVHVVLVDPPADAELLVRSRLERLERLWSRFLPQSDISRLNSAPGAWLSVAPETLALLAAMKQAWRHTGHGYDPTLLAPLLDAGYTRSVLATRAISATAPCSDTPQTIDDVVVDPAAAAVRVPAGVGLDAGGIGKGLAADLLVADLLESGAAGALVSIGGDLAAAGAPPSAEGWFVNVQDPLDPEGVLATLELGQGGVATSSTRSRTWRHDGHLVHHQIDPTTRAVADTDLAAVTVVAGTAWEAEAHATAAILCGSQRVAGYLTARQLAGIAVADDGSTVTSGGLAVTRLDLVAR